MAGIDEDEDDDDETYNEPDIPMEMDDGWNWMSHDRKEYS